MEIINLVIFSRDNDYGLALGEALSIFKNNFVVNVCRNEDEIFGIRDFDVLIVDSDDIETGETFGKERVIRLTESRPDHEAKLDPKNFILYKHSSVRELAAGILLCHSLLTGKRNFLWPSEKPKIVAFCSAKGGTGKTTVAFGVCQAIRRYYAKSVLYVSMEEIESTLLYMKGREDGFDLCAYLYYLFKAQGQNPNNEAFMLCDKFGVNAFMPDKGINRLRELTMDEMTLFFKEISENGAYDYIVIDMGESFSEKVKWIFQVCHKIIVVSPPPEQERDDRQERFLNYLRFVTGESKEDVIISVVNKTKDREDGLGTEENITIEFDPDSIVHNGEVFEISLDQDFGVGIKKLVKQMI